MADTSGEALYERYKEALKRGHVASLRGRLEEALSAYAEAAQIAPERPTPHTSAGAALLRRRRPADALRYYGVALRLAPRDEAALLGRAQALAALDRRGEAAVAFDTLAEVREAAGKLGEAVDAARRSLELAEGRERRRGLERLIELLRAAEPDEPARGALDQALQVLEGVAVAPLGAPVAVEEAGTPGHAAAPTETTASVEAGAEPAPAAAVVRAPLDRDLAPDMDPAAFARAADAALDAGDATGALERLLDLAAAHRAAGRVDAAIDACYQALSVAPDDVGLHLALAVLYGERGWSSLAGEKLDLLSTLADLDDDAGARERVAAVRSGAG